MNLQRAYCLRLICWLILLAWGPIRAVAEPRESPSIWVQTLQSQLDRAQPFYVSGETLRARMAFQLSRRERAPHSDRDRQPRGKAHGKPVRGTLHWHLLATSDGHPITGGAVRIDAVPNQTALDELTLDVPIPAAEGVYELRLTLSGRGFEDAQSGKLFIVLNKTLRSRTSVESAKPGQADEKLLEKLVDGFDPRQPGAGRRVALSREEDVKARRRGSNLPDSNSTSSIRASAEAQLEWSAYDLKLSHPHQPHRLVLTMPAELSQEIGVACIASERGQLPVRSLDTAIWTGPSSQASLHRGELRSEWLYWPDRPDSRLVVHNLWNGQLPQVTKVELYQLPAHLPPAQVTANLHRRRLVGTYLPRLAAGVSSASIPATVGPIAEKERQWSVVFQSASRLIELSKYRGHNALLLGVMPEGEPIYPSRYLETKPDRGTGSEQTTSQSETPDQLELLFRMFDREDLTLIPELQLRTRLPALERLQQDGKVAKPGSSGGILLRDYLGRTGVEASRSGGISAPYYNPLDASVQKAILEVVGELVDRSQRHPSYRGISLELGPLSYLNLPGLEWGYDGETLARFARESQLPVPLEQVNGVYARAYTYLTTTARRQWVAWRGREIARFHQALAARVTAAKPGTDLFLSGGGFNELESNNEESFTNQLMTIGRSREVQLVGGIDLLQLPENDRIVPLYSSAEIYPNVISRRSQIETVSAMTGLSSPVMNSRHGHLVLHSTQRVALPQKVSVGQRNRDSLAPPEVILSPQKLARGSVLRQPYTAAIAASDPEVIFDGSFPFSTSLDESLLRLQRAFGALPAVRFQNAFSQPVQPLVVRSATVEGATCFYAVNPTDLPIRVELCLSSAANVRCVRLGTPETFALREDDDANQSWLTFDLDAHDLCCGQIAEPDVRFVKATATPTGDGLKQFRDRINRLQANLTGLEAAATENVSTVPANSGFEKPATADGRISDWELSKNGADAQQLDRTRPHSGNWSLRINGRQKMKLTGPAMTFSRADPIQAVVWLRGSRADCRARIGWQSTESARVPQTEVILGIEWRRFSVLGRRPFCKGPISLQFVVESVDDADIWVDDVQFQSRQPTPYEIRQFTKMLSALNLAWETGRYGDCQRLVNGRWGRILEEASTVTPMAERRLPIAEKPGDIIRRQ